MTGSLAYLANLPSVPLFRGKDEDAAVLGVQGFHPELIITFMLFTCMYERLGRDISRREG